jgi:DNA-binding CsgD family transcriptional regulator
MLHKKTAYELDITEKTVKALRGRVMAKLGVDSV